MNRTIAIIGDGAMGTVCANMLAENGSRVRLWSAFPEQGRELAETRENRRFLPGHPLHENIEIAWEDDTAFEGVDLAFSAVPTQFVRSVWSRLADAAPADMPICSVTKGLENRTLLRPTEILRNVLDKGADSRVLAALSGPAIAPEIAEHLPASVAIAAETGPCRKEIQQLISRPYFRAYTTPDLVGLELAGGTKNVIAIAAGVLDGMEAGDNAKAALLSRGLAEITRLGVVLGAQEETFYGLAGVGDLVTTCISPVGRNRSFGERIGRGMSVREALEATESVVEGVPTTESVAELAEKMNVEMPLTQAIHGVLQEQMSPQEAIDSLMTRPLKSELEN